MFPDVPALKNELLKSNLHERFSVVVVCDGSLHLRRAASWEDWGECGCASKGQTYTQMPENKGLN